ncbi:hypothetical protein LNKW23_30060 [Paralimibaculum aggregatum]|uniref:Uncharacterized protein n=1 Tax=Paralimibaculum aggregatum TaxID=3036245 RepID=A0ABQ6LKL6_9RHOB|nr:hypothetical protein [Limibaculum sp. NKW23]GMG83792.1 hypothetical protein LNKW23_30060 [Limibaculum sp. NKW23]
MRRTGHANRPAPGGAGGALVALRRAGLAAPLGTPPSGADDAGSREHFRDALPDLASAPAVLAAARLAAAAPERRGSKAAHRRSGTPVEDVVIVDKAPGGISRFCAAAQPLRSHRPFAAMVARLGIPVPALAGAQVVPDGSGRGNSAKGFWTGAPGRHCLASGAKRRTFARRVAGGETTVSRTEVTG